MALWFETPLGNAALTERMQQIAVERTKLEQFETVLQRLVAQQEGSLNSLVTPENCMKSPTILAIVTAVARRISVSPVMLYERGEKNDRETKQKLPNHPVTRLLNRPNEWQTRTSFWLDATSSLIRHGNFYAWKGRGKTGPIRRLVPLRAGAVSITQDENLDIIYRATFDHGKFREFGPEEMFHTRGPARDYLRGDSPVADVQMAITMEILAEQFGAAFFQNGAMPFIFLHFLAGNKFANKETQDAFEESFQRAFGGPRKFRIGVLPAGFDKPTTIPVENDRAQFLETRKYQRTVIAGAFGVPPHLVGDLERGTMNNVEQQSEDFKLNVVLPVAQQFEAAMERDLLTDADRASGVIIRFNMDAVLRVAFRERQEGLAIQKNNNIISANEWREIEGKNPLEDEDGGEDYTHPANMMVTGEEPVPPAPAAPPHTVPGKYRLRWIWHKFDPDQQRDDHGRWSETGAGGGSERQPRGAIGERPPPRDRTPVDQPARPGFADEGAATSRAEQARRTQMSPEEEVARLMDEDEAFEDLVGNFEHGRFGPAAQELNAQLQRAGGFTYQPVTQDSPKAGFALSILPGHEQVISGSVNRREIATYLAEHADIMETNPSAHVGGWFDPESGKTYLDISVVEPNRERAISMAREHNQVAIYDLGTHETVRVGKETGKADSLRFSAGGDSGRDRGSDRETEARARQGRLADYLERIA